jgi:5-(carboxyamino)imidazole ribonucleotide mutase
MPAGVPVATVAIGTAGARNSAHLAARILALEDADLARRLKGKRRATEKRLLAGSSGRAHAG